MLHYDNILELIDYEIVMYYISRDFLKVECEFTFEFIF